MLAVKRFWIEQEEIEALDVVGELIDEVCNAINNYIIDPSCPVPCTGDEIRSFTEWLTEHRECI